MLIQIYSDAIALATRFLAPIFTYENILDKAGVYLKLKDESEIDEDNIVLGDLITESIEETSYSSVTLKDLNKQMNEAVANEDYELAAKIRDEINKRNKK